MRLTCKLRFSRTLFQLFNNKFRPNHNQYHSSVGVYGFTPDARIKINNQVSSETLVARNENPNIYRLISAYQNFGHLNADVNPLAKKPQINLPELNPSHYGLHGSMTLNPSGLYSRVQKEISIDQLCQDLAETYCGFIGAEFAYLTTEEEREFIASGIEHELQYKFSNEEKIALAVHMLQSQTWDNFLANKFQSVKRYGGEGAEAIVGYFLSTFQALARANVAECVIGMAHRGRINLLTGLMNLNPSLVFKKLTGISEFPPDAICTGDVLSHLASTTDLTFNDKTLHVKMLPNPSHLEVINAVVCGKVRAKQKWRKEGHYAENNRESLEGDDVVGLLIHGDAALIGQGINQEALAFSQVPHFSTGGSIHMCTNNQVGYTTPSDRTRSTLYCTDIAKMGACPVLHVNGDEPEAVMKAAKLAVMYQRQFRKDIFVDLICWRRWGHNELDNPRFTNPTMYQNIDNRMSVPDKYASSLISSGILTQDEVNKIHSDYYENLNQHYKQANTYEPEATYLQSQWSICNQAPNTRQTWDTGVEVERLKYVGSKSVELPKDLNFHPHLHKTFVLARLKRLTEGTGIDWATGEALAFASLIDQGYSIRLCGQDVGRGTFSQRHCMIVDQANDEIYIPLNHMNESPPKSVPWNNQGTVFENPREKNSSDGTVNVQNGYLEVANSILSEEAVLGFEYGFSLQCPKTLCIWEAQFGDFYNGAQIPIDTLVSSGETKWMFQSGLVMLLPHGFDGAGPEHSSCHIERFLQLCDSKENQVDSEGVNWNVAAPTTPAQFFHLLRKQVIRDFRKPLIVAGPKSLLRLPAATSNINEMAPGTHYKPVIDDTTAPPPSQVRRLVFCSGKHYYHLKEEQKQRGVSEMAIIRVELLCPFPAGEVNEVIKKYNKAKVIVWSQEEHRNMGCWFFVNPRFRNLCATQLVYAGRDELGTTAVGTAKRHNEEIKQLMDDTFNCK